MFYQVMELRYPGTQETSLRRRLHSTASSESEWSY
jgi:hypothetical protein